MKNRTYVRTQLTGTVISFLWHKTLAYIYMCLADTSINENHKYGVKLEATQGRLLPITITVTVHVSYHQIFTRLAKFVRCLSDI